MLPSLAAESGQLEFNGLCCIYPVARLVLCLLCPFLGTFWGYQDFCIVKVVFLSQMNFITILMTLDFNNYGGTFIVKVFSCPYAIGGKNKCM